MDEFISRQNIKNYETQMLLATEGPRKATIRALLKTEEQALKEWLTAKG